MLADGGRLAPLFFGFGRVRFFSLLPPAEKNFGKVPERNSGMSEEFVLSYE